MKIEQVNLFRLYHGDAIVYSFSPICIHHYSLQCQLLNLDIGLGHMLPNYVTTHVKDYHDCNINGVCHWYNFYVKDCVGFTSNLLPSEPFDGDHYHFVFDGMTWNLLKGICASPLV